jgi:hypothetical protein
LVWIRRIVVMLAAVAVLFGALASSKPAAASPVDASFTNILAQGTPTEEPVPTEIPPTAVPPTEIPATQVPPTSIPPTEDPPTQGPALTFAPDPPTPTEEGRISITVLPGTGGPVAPASGSPTVALVLIAAALLAASIAIRNPARSRQEKDSTRSEAVFHMRPGKRPFQPRTRMILPLRDEGTFHE